MSALPRTIRDDLRRWLTFRLAGETYGIDVLKVQEVLRVSETTPVPGAPRSVLGLIELRGEVVTVLDPRMLLGIPVSDLTDDSRIVIVEADAGSAGLLVDRVLELVDIRAAEIGPPPRLGKDEDTPYIHGVHSGRAQVLILIDPDALVAECARAAAGQP